MNQREQELFEFIEKDISLLQLIKDIVELEVQLDYLRKLPKIKVHPTDPTRQKTLPAGKQYKEYLQQYINALKVLQRRAGVDELEEESPLRAWLNSQMGEE